MLTNRKNFKNLLPGTILALVVFGIYYSGLSGPFMLDDHSNIPQSHLSAFSLSELIRSMLSNTSGPLGRPLASLFFSLSSYFFGASPFVAKFFNLTIHLGNGLLIYLLCHVILTRLKYESPKRAAYWTAAIWLCHPLLVSTTLYAVQLMTLLSSTFILCALLSYIHNRDEHPVRAGILFLVFVSLAILTKETAASAFLYLLIIEYSIFQDRKDTNGILISLVAWLPITVCTLYLSSIFDSWIVYHIKKHSLPLARIITESNVLWDYVSLIFWPNPTNLNLFHDDYQLVTQLDRRTLLGIAGWFIAILISFISRKRDPLLYICILWFLAGHLLEATILPIELFFEHRNYLPLLGPVFYIVGKLSTKERVFFPSVLILFLTLCSLTTYRSYLWGDSFRFASNQVISHPLSARANIQLANAYYSRRDSINALMYVERSIEQAKDDPGYEIFKMRISCLNGDLNEQDIMRAKRILTIGRNYSFTNTVMTRIIQEIQDNPCPPLDMTTLSMLMESAISSPYAYLSEAQLSHSYLLLARTYQNRGLFEQSVQAYEKSCQSNPTRAFAPLSELATLQLKLKDLTGYLESKERLMALNQYRFPQIKAMIEKLDTQAQGLY